MKSRHVDNGNSLQWVLVQASKRSAPALEHTERAHEGATNMLLIRASARSAACTRQLSRTNGSLLRGRKALAEIQSRVGTLKALVDLRPKPKEPKRDGHADS